MLRIGKMTDYGVVLLSYFARWEASRVFNAKELSKQSKLPLPSVSKILKALSRGGILESQRGASGGYRLTRSAKEISIAEIISLLEGPVSLTECSVSEACACALEISCPSRNGWRKMNRAVIQALEGITLSDMTCNVDESNEVLRARSSTKISTVPTIDNENYDENYFCR